MSLNLPNPPRQYTQGLEGERNRLLELADQKNLKRDQDVELVYGSIILHASDGSRWKLVVSPTGTISTTPA